MEQAIARVIEDLLPYADQNATIEIVMRDQKKRYKKFVKVLLDASKDEQQTEQIKEALQKLSGQRDIGRLNLEKLGAIQNIGMLSTALSAVNLAATAVGFAVVCAKIDKIGTSIEELKALVKKVEDVHTQFDFNKVVSEHRNMLDKRKLNKDYSEDEMRKLVDDEYNTLKYLYDAFRADIVFDKEVLLFSIITMAEMLSASICYFDEIYYFENQDAFTGTDCWHSSHDSWVALLDKLASPEMVKLVQDYGLLDKQYDTVTTDYTCLSYIDQIENLKQDIEDNQYMIITTQDRQLFTEIHNKAKDDVKAKLDAAIKEVGMQFDALDEAVQLAVA